MIWKKYLTRKYTLFEHWLLVHMLSPSKNPSAEGIYYEYMLDVSRKGLIDIYVNEADLERNREWIKTQDIPLLLEKGKQETKRLGEAIKKFVVNLASNQEIIVELQRLDQAFKRYSLFIEFVRYVEDAGIILTAKQTQELAVFNDYRKDIFMSFLKHFTTLTVEIAQKLEFHAPDFSYLTFEEVILLLNGELDQKEAEILCAKRSQKYFALMIKDHEKIITDNFESELAKLNLLEHTAKEIKGLSINSGIVKGEVVIVKRDHKKIPPGKIIVTHQTYPEMTPFLKKSLAIVTEEGGLLCHAANVCREFGIPGVLGTKVATKLLKDGDLVEVDANKGIVKVIKRG